ncbi:MAG: iron ABC transporter permease [Rhodospirillales bacterium]|nr:iron ABC transporter permease [Rhodospirillales bacterium]
MVTRPASPVMGLSLKPGKKLRLRFDIWNLGTIVIAVLASVPIVTVIAMAVIPNAAVGDIWRHLISTVLFNYTVTTLGLMLGVGAGTLVIGTGTAWLVTMCRFPGRRIFEWALLLPMAVPAYVIAYIYTDTLEYSGPVQSILRSWFGWSSGADYWFPEIRSLSGAVAMMTLVLYPYVYLLSRVAFLEQSVCALEAGRTLGRGPWRNFFQVALPLARPAIVIGVTLVLMETLNDFGTVDYFAVSTFTAGIFDVWLNMNSPSGAAGLASVLLMFVLVLIILERHARRGQRFHHTTGTYKALPGHRLSRGRGVMASMACALPVLLGFVLPGAVLVKYALIHYQLTLDAEYAIYTLNSLTLSVLAAVVAVTIGAFMAYGLRLSGTPVMKALTRVASLGYAVPGAVLAIGVMIPTAWLDNLVDGVMTETFGISTGLLLSGTIVALVIAYVVRFLALSLGTVEASLAKITPNMDGAARTLGHGPFSVFKRIHLPIMRGSILTAGILVFVDCMKELPMTVILRPFNFHTLATFVHEYASDELLAEASLAALTIVAAGILPVIILSLTITRSRPGYYFIAEAKP